jgi:cobalt/nickel transport system permease protein
MIEEPFAAGNSRVHRLDPRIRVVFGSVFSIVIAVADGWASLLTALGLALTLIVLARLKPAAVVRRLLWVNAFILLLWLVLPFSYDGRALWVMGPLNRESWLPARSRSSPTPSSAF